MLGKKLKHGPGSPRERAQLIVSAQMTSYTILGAFKLHLKNVAKMPVSVFSLLMGDYRAALEISWVKLQSDKVKSRNH